VTTLATFGARLRWAVKEWEQRTGEDLPQQRLADEVNRRGKLSYTQTAVSGWYRGAVPPLETIPVLAGFLGVTAAWLAFGEGPTLPSPQGPDVAAGENHLRAAQRVEHEQAAAKRKRPRKRG
jgi:transcriptional regulator with XRE-family HTH domain